MGHNKDEMMLIALQRSLRHDGGTPSMFLDTLYSAIENELWVKFGVSFRQLILADPPQGLGSSIEEIKQVIKLKHRDQDVDAETKERMDRLRGEVERLLASTANDHGVNIKPCSSSGPELLHGNGIKSREGDKAYILARLRRDNPDLAERVFDGELSAHAAGKQAGFIKPRQRFVPGDVGQTVKALERHYDTEGFENLQVALLPKAIDKVAKTIKKRFAPNQITELIRLLTED